MRPFLGLPRNLAQTNSPQTIKSGRGFNRKFFVRALFALKNDSQGSFTTRRGPVRHKEVKKADFKIWSFLAKNPGLTPWKKLDFWTIYKYSFKSFQSNQCVLKRPLRPFLRLPRNLAQTNSPQTMKSGRGFNRKFFVRALYFGQTPWTWKNVDFWTKYKYSFKSFQSNQFVRKRPLRQFLGLRRNQGQRNSPQKMKSGRAFNRKFFVRALFALKMIPKGVLRHDEICRDIKK